jgi:hypothetical protein
MKIQKEPVALIFFKRDTVFQVLSAIKDYKPEKLFLIADGGRNEDEHSICLNLRKKVESYIDWQCRVYKIYQDCNLGCRKGIPQGLDKIFQLVDRVIILEDDCVPSQDFFVFCEEMLEYYENDNRIFTIVGSNFLSHKKWGTNNSYFFSGYAETWGWATWKRCWEKYDADIKQWPLWVKEKMLSKIFLKKNEIAFWADVFQQVYDKTINCDPWDYQWLCMSFFLQSVFYSSCG